MPLLHIFIEPRNVLRARALSLTRREVYPVASFGAFKLFVTEVHTFAVSVDIVGLEIAVNGSSLRRKRI